MGDRRATGAGGDRGRRLAGLWTCLLALYAGGAWAGLITTERAWEPFYFQGGGVDYDPAPEVSIRSLGGAFAFVTDPFGGRGAQPEAKDPLRGSLHLGPTVEDTGDLRKANVSLYGSMPPTASLPERQLLADSLNAFAVETKGRPLSSLIDRDTVKGPFASEYRSAGVFMLASGIDEVSWIEGYKDASSTMQILKLEEAVARGLVPPGNARPAPSPGTLWMLAGGFVWLARRRLRATSGR